MKIELLSITPNAEKLIEEAARTCYASQDKMGEGSEGKLIKHLISSGHHSPLEHGVASFRVSDVSRAFLAQFSRHRLLSMSVKSQRYVNEENFTAVVPKTILNNDYALDRFYGCMSRIKRTYQDLVDLGIPKEDARYVLPNATTTELIVSANFREWRHIINLRCSKKAQWEIRDFANEVLLILKEHAPNVFEDL